MVFIDCKIPADDNCIVAQVVRQYEQTQGKARVPIVVLTTQITPQYNQVDDIPGVDDFITEPLQLQTLTVLINRWTTILSKVTTPAFVDTQKHKHLFPPALDHQMLKQLTNIIGRETTILLTQQFMVYAQEQLTVLRQLIATGDVSALPRKAHQLKGESLQVGATRLSALCQELEVLAQQGQLETLSVCLAKLEIEMLRVDAALAQVSDHE
jgi:HPt (histidine-containing phosphotransfer) domain-containing protein